LTGKTTNCNIARLLWGLMALYLLNISVANPDPESGNGKSLAHNNQESIAELVIEKLLGYEDVIAEYDEGDTDEQISRHTIKIDWNLPASDQMPKVALHQPARKNAVPNYREPYSLVFGTIFSPPPEV
jgi:hypothetical protein